MTVAELVELYERQWAAEVWLGRIAAHVPDAEFEAGATREGWHLVRWDDGHCELWGVVQSDTVPGVLLCDGDPVGTSGERYYYLGGLT